jgi:Cu-Zn family superoxide dismutase
MPLRASLGTGSVTVSDAGDGARVAVDACFPGLRDGEHGFHVHEYGGAECDAMGGHYDPHGRAHGSRDSSERHPGDLGNLRSVGGCVSANLHVRGLSEDAVAGRGIVLHELRDDLGRGGDDGSRRHGNSGPRVACGTLARVKNT